MSITKQLIQNISESKMVESTLAQIYKFSGQKPWRLGYSSHKRLSIEDAIKKNTPFNQALPAGYGYRLDERIVELPWFYDNLSDDPERILDAGSSLNFGYFLKSKKLQNKKVFISTLAPESRNYISGGVSYIFDDLRETCFLDNYFDSIACLSTLEHVGLDNTMLYTSDQSLRESSPEDYLQVISECYRILKLGGQLYLSFPFGKPINHGWFQVFSQEHVDQIINRFNPTSQSVSYFKYADSGWQISTEEACRDAETFDATAGLDYTEDFLAFSRSVCCLILKK